jgi:hypothetical protein
MNNEKSFLNFKCIVISVGENGGRHHRRLILLLPGNQSEKYTNNYDFHPYIFISESQIKLSYSFYKLSFLKTFPVFVAQFNDDIHDARFTEIELCGSKDFYYKSFGLSIELSLEDKKYGDIKSNFEKYYEKEKTRKLFDLLISQWQYASHYPKITINIDNPYLGLVPFPLKPLLIKINDNYQSDEFNVINLSNAIDHKILTVIYLWYSFTFRYSNPKNFILEDMIKYEH